MVSSVAVAENVRDLATGHGHGFPKYGKKTRPDWEYRYYSLSTLRSALSTVPTHIC
jgi:hypothetical protein